MRKLARERGPVSKQICPEKKPEFGGRGRGGSRVLKLPETYQYLRAQKKVWLGGSSFGV